MKLFLFFTITFFLTSCLATPSPALFTVPGNSQPVEGTPLAYPFPIEEPSQSGCPVPQEGANSVAEFPQVTRDPSLGSIKGRILLNGKPVQFADLYLAELLVNEEGKEVVFSFDRYSPLRTQTNQNGEFEFLNVPDGKYGLVYDVIVEAVLLLDPRTGDQLKFIIEGGQSIDTDDLDFQDLPKS